MEDPEVLELKEKNNNLTFTLNNVNVSIANGLRRIILSDIPMVVFKTSPCEKNLSNFYINTTRLNNEILKQRLSCIPIHINDINNFPIDNYIVEVNEENNSSEVQYVTTENFKIKNITNDQYLSKENTEKIFPPNNITKYFIDFVRLRPQLSDDIKGEKLIMNCKLSIGRAKDDAAFNTVSTCSYGFTKDEVKISEIWTKKEQDFKTQEMTKDEINYEKMNWTTLDSKRYYIENSFDFTIQSVGVYNNKKIVEMGCQIICDKIKSLIDNLDSIMINESDNTLENSYDIILENEDYTLGKILEYLIHEKYYKKNKVQFCGFIKKHPHDEYSIITIAYGNNKNEDKSPLGKLEIQQLLRDVCEDAINIYNNIKKWFN